MFTRNFNFILIANIILGAMMPILIIVGALAGAKLAPVMYLATLPLSVQMLAGIFVAAPISLFMGRQGRKAGFMLGALLMIFGGVLGAVALVKGWFILLTAAHFVLGAAFICINYFRFAAAEAVPEARRPSAISITLASGIVAALIGPSIFNFSKDFYLSGTFAGVYLAVSVLGVVGMIPVLALTGEMTTKTPKQNTNTGTSWAALLRRPSVALAIGTAALAHGLMVLLMTPTPLAIQAHGFDHAIAADVIRWHVIAMFAPGFVTGALIKRFGVVAIASTGLVILAGSSIVALMGVELMHFYGALILLGIGWNFGFIGGTQMLQSALSPEERPLVQGVNDTLLAIAAFVASLLSGVLFAGFGWGVTVAMALPILIIATFILGGLLRRTDGDFNQKLR